MFMVKGTTDQLHNMSAIKRIVNLHASHKTQIISNTNRNQPKCNHSIGDYM
jgi:hypothetical protein